MNKESRDYFLLKKIKEKDQNAFNEFYLKNEPLVYSLLRKYVHKTKDYEELVMCAKYGLVLAIYNFDLSYDTMFSTYAVPLILGEIKKYFKNLNLIKVSRRNQDLHKKIIEANDLLEKKLNRSPQVEEIASLLNVPLEDVIESLSSSINVSYLDEEISEDTSRMDLISDNALPLENKVELNLALENLDKKERLVIELRYFYGFTQQEVSKRLNMSQVQVSRIETKTLAKLKQMMI